MFNLPVASYYYRSKDNPQEPDYVTEMKVIHRDNFQSYGRRRIKFALENRSIFLGVFKIARLMRNAGVIAKVPKKPHDYPFEKQLPTIPNKLKRQFSPDKINTRWVGDIIYIRNNQGWSYLATVLDLGPREIVGYALSQTPDAQLARQALVNSVKMQQPVTHPFKFHSDQGVQYTAELFKHTLPLHGLTQSMSRRGNCWDNAVQERFFRSLKSEYLNGLSFINHQSVEIAIEHYTRYYNNNRINSVIDYITPAQRRQNLPNVA